MKTVSRSECEFLLEMLPDYVRHLDAHANTMLNRFVGLHSCRMYGVELFLVVMENIFLSTLPPHETYDLKGSWIDRTTPGAFLDKRRVMKDMDLKKYIILSEGNRARILAQLERDSAFLQAHNVMDYSLLLGIFYCKIARNDPARTRASHNKSHSQNDHHEEYMGGVGAPVIEGPGIYYMVSI